MRALLIAYACNPYRGSENGVGWTWMRCAAALGEVHVITAAHQLPDIERYLEEHPGELENVHFHAPPERPWHYRPTPGWIRIEHSGLKPLMNLAYAAWQKEARTLARRLAHEVAPDLIHQVTYVAFRFPGRYWDLGRPLRLGARRRDGQHPLATPPCPSIPEAGSTTPPAT